MFNLLPINYHRRNLKSLNSTEEKIEFENYRLAKRNLDRNIPMNINEFRLKIKPFWDIEECLLPCTQ